MQKKITLLFIMVFFVIPTIGCGTTTDTATQDPVTMVAGARHAYTVAVNIATDLAAGGVLSLEDAESFEEARVIAADALDVAEAAVAAGAGVDEIDLRTALITLQAVIQKLIEKRLDETHD